MQYNIIHTPFVVFSQYPLAFRECGHAQTSLQCLERESTPLRKSHWRGNLAAKPRTPIAASRGGEMRSPTPDAFSSVNSPNIERQYQKAGADKTKTTAPAR